MLANKFDRKIGIERKVKSVNTVGTPTTTYEHYKTRWANVDYRGGDTSDKGTHLRSYTDCTFTIRWDNYVDYDCRIMFNNSIYEIQHIEVIGRNEGMRIKTQMQD